MFTDKEIHEIRRPRYFRFSLRPFICSSYKTSLFAVLKISLSGTICVQDIHDILSNTFVTDICICEGLII